MSDNFNFWIKEKQKFFASETQFLEKEVKMLIKNKEFIKKPYHLFYLLRITLIAAIGGLLFGY